MMAKTLSHDADSFLCVEVQQAHQGHFSKVRNMIVTGLVLYSFSPVHVVGIEPKQ